MTSSTVDSLNASITCQRHVIRSVVGWLLCQRDIIVLSVCQVIMVYERTPLGNLEKNYHHIIADTVGDRAG